MGVCSLSSTTGYYFPQQSRDEETVVQLLNEVKIAIPNIELCRNDNLLTGLVCLFVYQPCVPETRTQLRLCDEARTLVSNFIDDCIPITDTGDSSIVDSFFATITNLSCPQNVLIPGVQVSESNCIEFKSK